MPLMLDLQSLSFQQNNFPQTSTNQCNCDKLHSEHKNVTFYLLLIFDPLDVHKPWLTISAFIFLNNRRQNIDNNVRKSQKYVVRCHIADNKTMTHNWRKVKLLLKEKNPFTQFLTVCYNNYACTWECRKISSMPSIQLLQCRKMN